MAGSPGAQSGRSMGGSEAGEGEGELASTSPGGIAFMAPSAALSSPWLPEAGPEWSGGARSSARKAAAKLVPRCP